MTRKTFLFLLAVFVMMIVVVLETHVLAMLRETEPNDTFEQADEFQLNGEEFAGQLYSTSDVDVFKFNVVSPGVLSFLIRPENSNYDGGSIRVTIKDSSSKFLASRIVTSDSTSVDVVANVAMYGQYYLIVDQNPGYTIFDKDYQITPSIDTDPIAISHREIEPNNTFSQANIFSTNRETYSGQLYSTSDVDIFKFNVSSPGVLSFLISPENSHYDGGSVAAAIYNSYSELLTYRKILSDYSSAKNVSMGINDPGDYFLVIDQNPGYTIFDKDYLFVPSLESSQNYEIEPNDSYENSMLISNGTIYTGLIYSDTDKDFYKLYLGNPGEISINISPENSIYDGGVLQISLLDSNKNVLISKELKSDSTVVNLTTSATEGIYYFVVENVQGYQILDDKEYIFTASFPEGQFLQYNLTLTSINPSSGVPITVSPNDSNGQTNGITPFTRIYFENAQVNLTAPPTAGSNNFQKWQLDGVDFSSSRTATITMSADYTMTAVYISPFYSISGTITLSGMALSGVTITLSGSSSESTVTDVSGNYSFTGLSNGTYTITPAKPGYTFTSTSRIVQISGSDVTGVDFVAIKDTTQCSTWNNVIDKYNAYVAGQAQWTDVITCYGEYASH